MSGQMERLVFVGIVRLLKYRHVIRSALMKVTVFVRVHGIDLQAYHLEIFSGCLTGFTDIFHVGSFPALAGEDQDLLQTGFCDGFHLFLDTRLIQLGPFNLVVAVESAVYTVIFAIIGNVQRREQIDAVPEMTPGLILRPRCHLFQEGQSGRRQQRFIIFQTAALMGKRRFYI